MYVLQKWQQSSLTARVLVGMVLGICVGLTAQIFFPESAFFTRYFSDGLFSILGQIFMACLKMLIVPLIFVSLVAGTCSLGDARSLGRLGMRTVGLYLLTTCLAITLAIMGGLLVQPGEGANLASAASFSAQAAPSLGEIVVSMFPTNPIGAMAEGNSLQIIVLALMFGLAVSAAGSRATRVVELFTGLNEAMMKLVAMVMQFAPYGVFALMGRLFFRIEFSAIANLLAYFLLVAGLLIVQLLVTYSGLLRLFAGLNPFMFLKKMESAIMFAFSTASSNATIPVSMETVNFRMGVSSRVSSFTIPLGATINMDGTAIMQGVATVFIAQAFGVPLGLSDYLTVILMATLASVGAAGVPGVGLVTLAMVLNQVGLPLEGVALVLGVDRLLDMIRTAVNITGDCVVTCIVAKHEGALDESVYNDPNAMDLAVSFPEKSRDPAVG